MKPRPITLSKEATQAKQVFTAWREHPVQFVQQAIIDPYNAATGKTVRMTTQQREATEAVKALVAAKLARHAGTATPEQTQLAKKIGISIMAGRVIGKDAWLSWMILWFLSLFPYCKIPCTSPSADQLYKVLWSEIAKWLEHSLVKSWLAMQNDKLYFTDLKPEVVGRRWFAFPKTANPKATVQEQVETLSGINEEYLMVAVDEASGIHPAIFQTLEGSLMGKCNFMVLIFNPTRSTGYAIDTQGKDSEYWVTAQWNAEESELGSVSEQARLLDKYGRDSNPYRVRVLGLPPMTDAQTLIPWDWIQEAIGRELEGNEKEPLLKGVDCGAGGDSSIICTRKGYEVFPLQRLTTPDSMVLANWIGNDIDAERPDSVWIDTIGIGWAVEGLVRDKKGAVVEGADFRRTPDRPDKYVNKRAESYDRLRDAFERGVISIPDDRDLIDQLSAIRCEYVGSKMKILDKKKLKKTIGHSPDEADALAMTFYRDRSMVSKQTRPPIRLASVWSARQEAGWLRA